MCLVPSRRWQFLSLLRRTLPTMQRHGDRQDINELQLLVTHLNWQRWQLVFRRKHCFSTNTSAANKQSGKDTFGGSICLSSSAVKSLSSSTRSLRYSETQNTESSTPIFASKRVALFLQLFFGTEDFVPSPLLRSPVLSIFVCSFASVFRRVSVKAVSTIRGADTIPVCKR